MDHSTQSITPLRQRMIEDLRHAQALREDPNPLPSRGATAGQVSAALARHGDRRGPARHYGLIANAERKEFARARELLHVIPDVDAQSQEADAPDSSVQPTFVCPDCGTAMLIIDTFVRGQPIRTPPRARAAA